MCARVWHMHLQVHARTRTRTRGGVGSLSLSLGAFSFSFSLSLSFSAAFRLIPADSRGFRLQATDNTYDLPLSLVDLTAYLRYTSFHYAYTATAHGLRWTPPLGPESWGPGPGPGPGPDTYYWSDLDDAIRTLGLLLEL